MTDSSASSSSSVSSSTPSMLAKLAPPQLPQPRSVLQANVGSPLRRTNSIPIPVPVLAAVRVDSRQGRPSIDAGPAPALAPPAPAPALAPPAPAPPAPAAHESRAPPHQHHQQHRHAPPHQHHHQHHHHRPQQQPPPARPSQPPPPPHPRRSTSRHARPHSPSGTIIHPSREDSILCCSKVLHKHILAAEQKIARRQQLRTPPPRPLPVSSTASTAANTPSPSGSTSSSLSSSVLLSTSSPSSSSSSSSSSSASSYRPPNYNSMSSSPHSHDAVPSPAIPPLAAHSIATFIPSDDSTIESSSSFSSFSSLFCSSLFASIGSVLLRLVSAPDVDYVDDVSATMIAAGWGAAGPLYHTDPFDVSHFLSAAYSPYTSPCLPSCAALFGTVYEQIAHTHVVPVPSLDNICTLIRRVYSHAILNPECVIIALIYIERLMEHRSMLLTKRNWIPVVLIAILIASKVWDDHCLFNAEFANIFPMFSLPSINHLERTFLTALTYTLYISSSEYARYYFGLRSLRKKEVRDIPRFYLKVGIGRSRAIERRTIDEGDDGREREQDAIHVDDGASLMMVNAGAARPAIAEPRDSPSMQLLSTSL